MAHYLHHGDFPASLSFGDAVAIDTETLGLKPGRDRLCLVQLSDGKGDAHLVKIGAQQNPPVHLLRLLQDESVLKLFHFARFDLAILYKTFGVMPQRVYCTKIASKLTRTYTDRHGLKDLARELLSVDISKQQQTSDWGADELSDAQLSYAASDVLYLHALRAKLDVLLTREGRTELAQACFQFLPSRALLDLNGWDDVDIFAHS